MTAVSAPRSYRLELDDIASVPVRVVRAPQLSLLSWLVDAAAKPSASRTAAALVGVLSAEGRRVLPALGMPGLDRLPDTIVAAGNGVAGSVAEHAERLGDADGSRLAEEVHALWGGRPPGPWRAVADRPRTWLRGAARAFLDGWTLGQVHYRAAELLLRREEARIGAAAITGNLAPALSGLSPRLRVGPQFLEFDADCGQRIRLGNRTLALVPMLVPGARMIVDFAATDHAYVAYSLPGAGAAPVDAPAPVVATDGLTALLGPIRAAVLRAIDRPVSMQVLARTVHCSPSTLTYHCDQLVLAGLLHRERHGRSVLVSASERARALVDLMS